MGQCTAISKRSKQRCLNWGIRKRTTCRMHGGCSKGPITCVGKEKTRQAALKHGGYTKKAIAEHKEAMRLIKMSKDILNPSCYLRSDEGKGKSRHQHHELEDKSLVGYSVNMSGQPTHHFTEGCFDRFTDFLPIAVINQTLPSR